MSLAMQMGNIGSEVSRALKWKAKGKKERSERAAYRALELVDLSIRAAQQCSGAKRRSRLKELCRDREELCDYFFGDNEFHTDPVKLQRYYDQFVLMSGRS